MHEITDKELTRLDALFEYRILDTPPEPAFDAITQLATSICDVPIALISLVDDYRQWFKSVQGLSVRSTPREMAFCAYAIQDRHLMEVKDALQDDRFSDNPLVTGEPNIRFYAGQPLTSQDGHELGTLCVIDREPKKLSEAQRSQLKHLALLVMNLLESHKQSLKNNVGNILEESFNEIYLINASTLAIEHANRAAISALQRTGEDIRRHTLVDICHDFDNDVSPVLSELKKCEQGSRVIETMLMPKDSDSYHAEIRLQFVSQPDSEDYFVVIANNIEERKLSEQAMQEAQDFYKTILRDFPLLIWHAGIDSQCDYFNHTWLSFTGRTLEQEVGEGWTKGVHPDDFQHRLDIYLSAFEKREPFEMEYRLKRSDGEYRLMIDWGRPYYNLKGDFSGYIGALQDITEQKDAQRNLLQHRATLAQVGRFNLLSEMATNLAHELNQPLTSISNYCDAALDIVEKLPSSNEALLKAMSRASVQSKHAGGIIRHLRQFLRRGGESEKESTSINMLIKRTLQLLDVDIKQKNIKIKIMLEQQLPEIIVDVIQIEQVIINLLRNAIDALTFDVSKNNEIAIFSSLDASAQCIDVLVQDNGPGVSSEFKQGPFEHFSTTKPDGLGLGLAISGSIIEAHSGKIWLDSSYEAGARFCFSLPIH